MKIFYTLILMFIGSSFALTPVKGNLENYILTSDKSPYLIEDNIVINEGQSLVIGEGSVLLFKPFTGIIIEGTFRVEGTLKNPVVFTSINDSVYNPQADQLPNPFDWNGILIGAKSKQVSLSNFLLTYSVYGIKSMKNEFIINNGTFNLNGQFHIVVNDAIKPAIDGVPFNYGANGYPENDNASDKKPKKIIQRSRKLVMLTVSGAGCGAGAAVSAIMFFNARKNYIDETNPARQSILKGKIIGSLIGTGIFTAATATLVPTAIIIKRKDKRKTISTVINITPVLQNGPGGALTIHF